MPSVPIPTPSEYANSARCYDCEIPPGAQFSVAIYLLAQIYKVSFPMADISPSALANAARCYNCEIPPGDQFGVANYLLTQINAGGGGGGGGCQGTIYRASPSNPEPPPANVACAERLVFLDGSPIIYWIPAPVSAWSNTL